MYLTLRRLGWDVDAASLLSTIRKDMDIIEHHTYHRLLLIYKVDEDPAQARSYDPGMWHLLKGEKDQARQAFKRVVETNQRPAFGVIAAEAKPARRAD